jgi:hypothetical protein
MLSFFPKAREKLSTTIRGFEKFMIKDFPTTPYPPPYLRRGIQVLPFVLSFIRRGNRSD